MICSFISCGASSDTSNDNNDENISEDGGDGVEIPGADTSGGDTSGGEYGNTNDNEWDENN